MRRITYQPPSPAGWLRKNSYGIHQLIATNPPMDKSMNFRPARLRDSYDRSRTHTFLLGCFLLGTIILTTSCSVIKTGFSTLRTGYRVVKGTVKGTIWVARGTYQLTKENTKLMYHIGTFAFEVVRAPSEYPVIRDDVQTMDGLPVKEAIRLGRVKTAPYTVKGQYYRPDDRCQRTDLRRNGLGLVVWGRNLASAWRGDDCQW